MLASILVNKVSVDYARGTTFAGHRYRECVKKMLKNIDTSPRPARRYQYSGDLLGNVFHGQGDQSGRTSYMVDVSGADANDYYQTMIDSEMKFTRLDIQVTTELPHWYSSRSYKDFLKSAVWSGQKLNVELIEGKNGSDTVYIGSRSSDKFIRVYVKDRNLLRFEIELSGKVVLAAVQKIDDGGEDAVRAILKGMIDRLPQHPITELFGGLCSGEGTHLAVYRVPADAQAKVRWLSSLLNTIEDMARDHDIGHTVRGWLMNIIAESE